LTKTIRKICLKITGIPGEMNITIDRVKSKVVINRTMSRPIIRQIIGGNIRRCMIRMNRTTNSRGYLIGSVLKKKGYWIISLKIFSTARNMRLETKRLSRRSTMYTG